MKKLIVVLTFFYFTLNTSILQAYSSNPKEFVTELVNDAITKLSSKDLNDEEKKNFIEGIASNNVDINALGLYTLGELRKTTDKNSLNKYQVVFHKYFLKSLTSRLTDYSSKKFEVVNTEKRARIIQL